MVNDEQELGSKISLAFPALHEGEYRLEFLIDGEWFYKNVTLTRTSTEHDASMPVDYYKLTY